MSAPRLTLSAEDLDDLGGGSLAPAAAAATTAHLTFDLALLTALDAAPVDAAALAARGEAYLAESAAAATKALVHAIFSLPLEDSPVGPLAVLPPRVTRLPRAQHAPRAKPPTRWEKFAAAKGITKKAKPRMAFDADAGAWAPRYGYGRAPGARDEGAYELKAGDDPTVDHLERLELQRAQRGVKNKLAHLGNVQRAERAAGAPGARGERAPGGADAAATRALRAGPAVDPSAAAAAAAARGKGAKKGKAKALPAWRAARDAARDAAEGGGGGGGGAARGAPPRRALPVGIAPVRIAEGRTDGVVDNGRRPRELAREPAAVKAERLALAAVSTASLGRFDARSRLPGEAPRPADPRRLKRAPNEVRGADEAKRHSDILRRVLAGEGRGAPAAAAKAAGGEGGGGGGGGDGGGGGGGGGGGARGGGAGAKRARGGGAGRGRGGGPGAKRPRK